MITSERDSAIDINLREIVAPLFRHRKKTLVVFFLVLVPALIIEFAWGTRYYKSEMQVLVEQDRSDPTISAGQSAAAVSKAVTIDQVTSEVQLLQGTDMLRATVQKCALANFAPSWKDIFRSEDPAKIHAIKEEAAVALLAKRIKVVADTESDLITVSYARVGEPETPFCVLDTLSKSYLDKHVILSHPRGSSAFFTNETEKYKEQLEAAEADLVRFGKDENIAAPDLIRTAMAQQVTSMQTSYQQVRQQIAADNDRITFLQTRMKTTPQRSPTLETSNDAAVLRQTLTAALLSAQNKKAQLLTSYDASFPLVREADLEIRQTEDAIQRANSASFQSKATDKDPLYETLREDLAKTQADLHSSTATLNVLSGSIQDVQRQMVRMDGLVIRSAALQREAKAAESNYLLYLSKREQERTSDALDVQGIANVAIAVKPIIPVIAVYSFSLVLLGVLFCSLLCAFSSAYIFEYLDPSFTTPHQITHALGIPVLASFPKIATP